MRNILKTAVIVSVFAMPAMSANLESPLYLPGSGEVYSKTGLGVMIKKADHSDAQKLKGHDGAIEFPMWRVREDLGIGITDRFAVTGSVMYTHDADIDRKGLNRGRVGVIGRPLQLSNGIVLDLYADAYLGGVSKMRGSLILAPKDPTKFVFQYDNYANGRWGFDGGLRFGKKWDKFTAGSFVEVVQTFGYHNNVINVAGLGIPVGGSLTPVAMLGIPPEISVNLKSTTEIDAGLDALYQIDRLWSVGGGFTYNHHADNGVKSLATEIPAAAAPVAAGLIEKLSNMDDGFDEYILSVVVARQMTNWLQLAMYGEYTFDTAHANSQNGSDVKAEIGVRLNAVF